MNADFTAGAEAMRAQVLALLDGKLKVLVHAATKGLDDAENKTVLSDQQLLNEICPQVAELQVQP